MVLLATVDIVNGFVNRFLLACVRRSKLLPFGGQVAPAIMHGLTQRLADAAAFARSLTAVKWTQPAMDLWKSEYPQLTGPRAEAYGKGTSRAEAHVLRLALLYALLDRSDRIEVTHLNAALAVWAYCDRSARYIFGDKLSDADAQKILDALRAAPSGLARHEIRRNVFKDNKPADHVASKLATLLRLGLAKAIKATAQGSGRPPERWFAVTCEKYPYVKNVEYVETRHPEGTNHVSHVNHAPPLGTDAAIEEGEL
jgi:hypothetical protein